MKRTLRLASLLACTMAIAHSTWSTADENGPAKAWIDGHGPGWRDLTAVDFTPGNVDPETFTWKGNGFDCTGQPIGVTRSKKSYTNLELAARWRHLKDAGNSGIFLWGVESSVDGLKRNQLPQGIEVQVLDTGYTARYEQQSGKKADWFTTHGDVFPTGGSRMTPFPPVSPDGSRSFPRKNLSRPAGQWNHYYIRAINGEVRVWVNGEEVSGGTNCSPRTGYLCFESEGSPVEFRDLRIRELP